jgi:hypothetical protein
MSIIEDTDPLWPPTTEFQILEAAAKLPQPIFAAILMGVSKWRVSGTYYRREPIDPTPDEPPFSQVASEAFSEILEIGAPFGSDEEIQAKILTGEIYFGNVATSGGFTAAIGSNGILTQSKISDNAARPFCQFAFNFSSADNSFVNSPTGSTTLTIKAFGQTFTTPARAEGAEGAEGGEGEEPEPDVPPPSDMMIEAIEYREYSGKWNPETGGPAIDEE